MKLLEVCVCPRCTSVCSDSPVQCCLIAMPQGNTVKKLKAHRKTPGWQSYSFEKLRIRNVCVCVCVCVCMYLIDSTHPCYGSYIISDGDQRGSGQVFLRNAVSLVFAHHVTKTVKQTFHMSHVNNHINTH